MALELPIENKKSDEDKRAFYSEHIFHERQMNSCPIGCVGCAVSASSSNQGALKFQDLVHLYKEARDLGVSLKITKVEGYDPVFVNYPDSSHVPFAESIVAAVDLGHRIITPVCTTGSWKSEKSKWQLEELGKLSNKYRKYTYPSMNRGEAFVLSVPREIRPFSNDRYNFEEHVEKLVLDVTLLTKGGNLEVLIYYNSKLDGDFDFAVKIKEALETKLSGLARERAKLMVTDFNADVMPESCMRYENSLLLTNEGFKGIDPITLEWKESDSKIPLTV